MAFSETYVTVAGAGAHDGSSEANAWTFAEMIAAAPAAETRVNIKAGSYSEGATTLPTSGTRSQPIVLRGYSSTIGDLDELGRSADGTLDTTNMPDIAITSTWVPSPYCFLQCLDISGALSAALMSSLNNDHFGFISCCLTNTQNNASAALVRGDDGTHFVLCDLICSGASHGTMIESDNFCCCYGCRFVPTSTSGLCVVFGAYATVLNSVFLGTANTSVAIGLKGHPNIVVAGNSIYNFGTAIRLPNLDMTGTLLVADNHVTDCGKYIDALYAATANSTAIEAYNRTRDNTTPRTGLLSIALTGEVTTDAGDYTTDYISATNLRLKSTASGKAQGMMPYKDIGAHGVAAPTLPAAEDVETGVTYGYADAELTGTLAAGGGGGVPVIGGNVVRRA